MHSLCIDYSLKFPDITSVNLSIIVPFVGILLLLFGRDLLELEDDFPKDWVPEEFIGLDRVQLGFVRTSCMFECCPPWCMHDLSRGIQCSSIFP